MRVLSPINVAILHNFRMGGCDSFHIDEQRKEITLFKMEECDRCGAQCRGANPIILTGRAYLKEKHKGLLVLTGFEPSEVTDELGATDEGDAVCPKCYAESVKEQEAAEAE